jgi:hypothetical protein
MDGVIADFTLGACRVHGREAFRPTTWDFWNEWGMSDAEFWGPIHDLREEFYGRFVEPYPWADEVIEAVRAADEFRVLTAAGSENPYCYSGKRMWWDKWFPGTSIIVCPSEDKSLLAQADRLLVDDSDKNINAFHYAGGYGLTLPQPWNNAAGVLPNRRGYVEVNLKVWRNRDRVQ